jgi:HD-GYP domain-containing protein (c-di-GMP phosphodiesterase class II)/pSer/pThr/pTyr-binding forkhead associated (FHA) protein
MTERRIRLRAVGSKLESNKNWEADRFLRIGRMEGLEVVIDDTSISRRHAEIAFTQQEWVARDTGSTNGTFLNGVRLGRTGQPLRTNDILQCGNVVLVVEAMTDTPLDFTETPCGSIQVQAMTRQSMEEVAHKLAMDVTLSTKPGEQLLSLMKAGQCLDWTDSLDDLLARNLQQTVAAMGARRGSLVLIDAKTGKMKLRAIYPSKPELWNGRFFSQTLAARCFRSGQSLLCADVISDPDLLQAASVNSAFMSSIICALLRSPQRYLGVLHLDRSVNDDPFTRDDLCRADALAANMSFAFESAQQLQEKQHAMFIQTVIAFSQVIELRDPYTGGHAQRVTDYALLLAEEMNLSETDRHHLRIGAPLHDIGKIGVDDNILRKSGLLTPEEFEQMKSHTVKGAALIETLPGLDVILPIVRSHHERWDGCGYPDQMAGDKIPALARLMAVVDTFDAMTTNRPYRTGLPIDVALAQIESCAGTQFDPQFAQAFLRLRPAIHQHMSQKDAMLQTLSPMQMQSTGCSLAAAESRKLRSPRFAEDSVLAAPAVLATAV